MVGPCPPQGDSEQWYGFNIQFIRTYSLRTKTYSHEGNRSGLHDEIVTWATENLTDSWTWLSPGQYQTSRTYWIRTKADALLFKLRWSQVIKVFVPSKQNG